MVRQGPNAYEGHSHLAISFILAKRKKNMLQLAFCIYPVAARTYWHFEQHLLLPFVEFKMQ
jgi:hypothetical protein